MVLAATLQTCFRSFVATKSTDAYLKRAQAISRQIIQAARCCHRTVSQFRSDIVSTKCDHENPEPVTTSHCPQVGIGADWPTVPSPRSDGGRPKTNIVAHARRSMTQNEAVPIYLALPKNLPGCPKSYFFVFFAWVSLRCLTTIARTRINSSSLIAG